MVFMKSLRRIRKTQSTKYSSLQGAESARWPLKMTRSKHESTPTIRLVNLTMKRDSVFMAFSSGKGLCNPYFGERTPSLLILFGCGYAALGTVIVLFPGLGVFGMTRRHQIHGRRHTHGGGRV